MLNRVAQALIISLFLSSKSFAISLNPIIKPFARLEFTPGHMLISKHDKFLAFTDANGNGLYVADLGTFKIIEVSPYKVGAGGFFFSPDGHRLLYRDHSKAANGKAQTHLLAYDLQSNKRTVLETLPTLTSYLNFDPRDYRLLLLHDKGILNKKLAYPESALAKWQKAQRTDRGRWVATQKGILWLSNAGYTMRKQDDDDTGVQSFSVSPDGLSIAWSTQGGKLYRASEGNTSVLVGEGSDPAWHPQRPLLLYSYPRRLGKKVIQNDLRVVDNSGAAKFVTYSQDLSEQSPQWSSEGSSILYALAGSTDVFQIEFK